MKNNSSSLKGKAYEYACLMALYVEISRYRDVEILENSSFVISKNHYLNDISSDERRDMQLSAKVGVEAIIQMEPKTIEKGCDVLELSIQPDNVARKFGDIRDVLVIRSGISWQIGVSVKHNHSALKHSRLSTSLDFGAAWLEKPCSKSYFSEIKPIFDELEKLKASKVKWSQVPDKMSKVYVPTLDAFKKEFLRLVDDNQSVEKLMSYLIASNGQDYYKMIHNNNHTTAVLPFNVYGTLNKSAGVDKPLIAVPKISLPTRIIEMEYKEKSQTTLILTMNGGWSISFRLHSASTIVEKSLKFDIQLQSKPEDILYINRTW
ncbi:MAG: HaeIII family restriction endonuclease [Rikenellaceae bacterium]